MLVALLATSSAFAQSVENDSSISTGLIITDDSTVFSLDFPDFISGSIVGTVEPDYGELVVDEDGELLYCPLSVNEELLDEFFVVVNTEDEGIQFLAGLYDPVDGLLYFGWPTQIEMTEEGVSEVATFHVTGFSTRETVFAISSDSDRYSMVAFQEEDETGHTTNRTPSNRPKHEAGDTRRDVDKGGEKADPNRRPVGKRPKNHKGPWPPTNKPKAPKTTGPRVKVNKYPKVKVFLPVQGLGIIADTLEDSKSTGKSFWEQLGETLTAPLRYDGYQDSPYGIPSGAG